MEDGVESVSLAVRCFIGFHLCTENSSEFCQEGRQISNRYLEEVINEVFPLFTIMKSKKKMQFMAPKFCVLDISMSQSISLSISLTSK